MKQDVKGEHHKALVLVQCGVLSLCPGVWCGVVKGVYKTKVAKSPRSKSLQEIENKVRSTVLRRYGSVLERVVIILKSS